MDKRTYLNQIHNYFFEKEVSNKDIAGVIEDYSELYDEAIALGFTDQEVIEKLGKPQDIYHAIKDTLHFDKSGGRHKIVAIMPFVATILFFTFGFALEGWSYAWAFYLLIPVVAILTNVRGKDKVVALTPFISIIGFFLLGFLLGAWHPGWLIFFTVPVTAILLNVNGKERMIGLMPFIVTIIYILVGTYVTFGFYYYGWAMYAIIPLTALIVHYKDVKDLILIIGIILAVIAHLTLYFTIGLLQYAWLPYLLPAVLGVLFGRINIITFDELDQKQHKIGVALALVVVIMYLVVSFLVKDIWQWSWIILMLIPMIGIYLGTKFKHPVAYMPFISVIVFMLLGVFGGYWEFAWIVFLSIPMVAILTESDDKSKVDKQDETSDN